MVERLRVTNTADRIEEARRQTSIALGEVSRASGNDIEVPDGLLGQLGEALSYLNDAEETVEDYA